MIGNLEKGNGDTKAKALYSFHSPGSKEVKVGRADFLPDTGHLRGQRGSDLQKILMMTQLRF